MYVILALLLLGVLIMAHEAGHYLAARACGIDTFIVEQDICDDDPLVSAEISYKNLKELI